jgi:hypothetical protein
MSLLYSMGSLVLLVRSRIVIYSIFKWFGWLRMILTMMIRRGVAEYTKLTVILSCYMAIVLSYCIIIIEVID